MSENIEPQIDNWKDAWEYNAGQTRDALLDFSEDELLAVIAEGKSDMYFQIWDVIGRKGSKVKAPAILIKYLEENTEACMDLSRAHCMEALFKILKTKNQDVIDDFYQRVVQMSVTEINMPVFQKGIIDLRKYILLI